MITFLPLADFTAVARLLDDKRLGGQRTEAWAILKWLRNPSEYPKLVKAGYCAMWSGYEDALVLYVNCMLVEWARRGKKNDLLQPHSAQLGLDESKNPSMPPWLGCEALHSYHRSALISKLPSHYGKLGWSETGDEVCDGPVPAALVAATRAVYGTPATGVGRSRRRTGTTSRSGTVWTPWRR